MANARSGTGGGGEGWARQRERARELRRQGWSIGAAAVEVGVPRGTVAGWVRGIEPPPLERTLPRVARGNRLRDAKEAEIAQLRDEGRARVGRLGERDLLVAGAALYAGEGGKTGGEVAFTNTDPRMVALFLRFLRGLVPVDEHRLRVRLYLHDDLDLEGAEQYWSDLTGVPRTQFGAPYRSPADPSRRRARHEFGCATVATPRRPR